MLMLSSMYYNCTWLSFKDSKKKLIQILPFVPHWLHFQAPIIVPFLNSMTLKSETQSELLAMPFSKSNLAKLPSQGSPSKSMIYISYLTRITSIFHKSLDSTELLAAFGLFFFVPRHCLWNHQTQQNMHIYIFLGLIILFIVLKLFYYNIFKNKFIVFNK